jgi:hypothetical protein
MKRIKKDISFILITDEEAAQISGGGPINYLIYMLLSQTPASPGGINITNDEINYGWLILINAAPGVNSFNDEYNDNNTIANRYSRSGRGALFFLRQLYSIESWL